MEKELAINIVRVTEAAALGGAPHMGRGDKNKADKGAVDSMRKMFNVLDIKGKVVIGEGEMDEAPMLYIGEEVGLWTENAPEMDVAVDPIDGTNLVASGLPNALSVIAVGPRGSLLHAPDMYMEKLAVGPRAKGAVDITFPISKNLQILSKVLGKHISEITVTMLNRRRHRDLIKSVRESGARLKLFNEGDVAAAIATCFEDSGVDIMIGSGGAPEGVITAAALKCLGGEFQGILDPYNDEEIQRCKDMGINDPYKVFYMDDLAKGNGLLFAATGISDGELLKGVRYYSENKVKTQSIVVRSATGTIRFIDAIHKLDKKPTYAKP